MPGIYKLYLISPGKENLNTTWKTEYKLADTRKEDNDISKEISW